jgi:hypothetical protein
MSDFTYVENVTHAHICAEEALDFRTVSVAGKVCLCLNCEFYILECTFFQ